MEDAGLLHLGLSHFAVSTGSKSVSACARSSGAGLTGRARSGWRRRCRSWSASSAGAAAYVLVKNAEALERTEKIDTLLVDKTGTLTEGKPKVVAFEPFGGMAEVELLQLTAAVERASPHPLPSPKPPRASFRSKSQLTSTHRPARALSVPSPVGALRSADPPI